jgi:hypothetical protein
MEGSKIHKAELLLTEVTFGGVQIYFCFVILSFLIRCEYMRYTRNAHLMLLVVST